MLLSDLLPLLYQNQLPMPLGGPAAALLPKSASNATGGNIPGVKTPPLSSPTEMMNAGTAATSASYENRLRELQGFNLKQQTELMSQLPGALQRIMALQSGGGGEDGQAAGNQASGASGVTGARSLGGGVEDDGSAAALVKRHESGGDYNIGTGGSDLSKAKLDENGFPIWEGHNGSHAAGAYQFQPGTWAPYAKQLGIKDFSPASQDAVFRAAYLDQGFKPWAPYNSKIAAALANGFKPNSVSGEETAPAGALGGGAGARMAQTLPPVPDFAGMMNGNQGSSYAPQTPQANGMVTVRDAAGTYNVPQAEFDRAASSGTPYPGKPLQLAQTGPLSSLPTTQAPPMPMGAPSPAAVAPRMMPGGAATNPNPQMSPLQQAIVQFGVLSRMAKLGDVATPLEQAFYNSPQFKAAQAAASMGATKPIELQYAAPIAGETARGGAPFKSPVYEALAGAQQFPPGSPQRQTMETAASNSAGIKPVLGGERPGVPIRQWNPATNRYEVTEQNPSVGQGQIYDQNAGQVINLPNAPQATQEMSTAHAAGGAAFRPVQVPGPYGRDFTTTALNLGNTLGNGQGNVSPRPVGGGLATSLPGVTPNPAAPPIAGQVKPASAEAATPTYPVNTPGGAKDLSAVTLDDMFPEGQGIPRPPEPPPGMTYGKPSATEIESQKGDAEQLNKFSAQAAGNQKVYQDLGHLREVLQAGLNTSNLAPLWADIGNIAQSLNLGSVLPKSFNPNDPAVFQKAATDLIFAAVSKLGGQVKVAEITGYAQANPSLTIPIPANLNILNDILSNGKWEDARAKLASQYVTKTGGAPLSAFNDMFNQMAPLVDVTASYKNAVRQTPEYQAGLVKGIGFPEDMRRDAKTPERSGAAMPEGATDKRVIGNSTYYKIGGKWYSQ